MIKGASHFLPSKIVTNEDISKFVDTTDEWIVKRTGIRERRWANRDKDEFPSTMATHAAKDLLQKLGVDQKTIEFILLSSTIGDMMFPNTASMVQHEMGMTHKVPCMDLNTACTGFIYGMVTASSMITAGCYKNVLLLCSEMMTRLINTADRASFPLFGDGAGAAFIVPADNDFSQIHAFELASDPLGKDLLIHPYGACRFPITKEMIDDEAMYPTMRGPELYLFAVRELIRITKSVVEKSQIDWSDIDWFLPHQANQRILETVLKGLPLAPEKVMMHLERYGNTSSACIPIMLSEGLASGQIKRGQKILMTSFGAGLTSASMLITL